MAKSSPVSPLAPKQVPVLPPIKGVTLATAEAGIKYKGRTDVMAMIFDKPAAVAGVFTKSKCPSAPVDLCRAHLPKGRAKILVVNSGNANAFTGKKGAAATKLTAEIAAKAANCDFDEVYLSSTGVIGEPLDATKFEGHIEKMVQNASPDAWLQSAQAIMTTDTFAKVATQQVEIDGKTYTVNGMAKGAGMIAPDMATMLAYIVTDAPVSAAVLQNYLTQSTETTFNAVTVDGDTSTSDTLLAFATGPADYTNPEDKKLVAFKSAFHDVLHNLAMQIIRDGEGIRKVMRIEVEGATSKAAAKKIAMSIANSPLVKTAVAGEDANWGRIVMAVGKAGEPADRDRLQIRFGDIVVARDGEREEGYSEEACAAYMKNDEIVIGVDIGLGSERFTAWGCDLTKEYVEINGDYRS
ncbi:bifunctional glutamate N-acetyltransferase/amino-acid acetyltransferase ArgJ [Ahrensia marina]|uniref:Arginine biosynthesis bifunctional protein ArgJ n=1 Tax=Ahrensia marina TaxID=1514904 RepID=A0A0M9GL39_9HYPH|nr:bifunctional glutamate N-acetyltransferase/amino-acid acetyltransferase ArgJ [Ahrensia marina]KPB00263.1 N-acetylglutamate synthase [Ahrensia marina]